MPCFNAWFKITRDKKMPVLMPGLKSPEIQGCPVLMPGLKSPEIKGCLVLMPGFKITRDKKMPCFNAWF